MNKILILIFTILVVFCFYMISDNIGYIDKIVYELVDDYRTLSMETEGDAVLTDEILVQVKLDIKNFSEITDIDIEDNVQYKKAAEQYYEELNNKYLSGINLNNYKSVYVSKYSPYIEYTYETDKYYNLKNVIANEINVNDYIQTACIKENLENKKELINNAMYMAGAYDQYYNPRYTGRGIKVGLLEPGLVDKNAICFSSGQVITFDQPNFSESITEHATHMAAYIGGSDGIAKNVKIYSASINGNITEEIEWLISNGVNVINMSFGEVYPSGEYNFLSSICDFYTFEYGIPIVAAVGNEGNSSNYVCNPALGYNVIGVGSGCDLGSADSFSSVLEVNGPPKPLILAKGNSVLLSSLSLCSTGTSVSCAIVSGILALLIEKYPAMTYRPDQMIAMLACSAYQSPYAIIMQHGLNEAGGAGLIRYDCFMDQYSGYQYIINSSGVHGQVMRSVNVNLTSGTKYKASCAWMAYTDGTVDSLAFTDYDLFVYGPDGNLVAYANSGNSNVELVSFTAVYSGTYTITVKQHDVMLTSEDRIILCHGEAPEALIR